MDEPRVSVVMPVFNGERYVGRAIESVLRQSMADLELFVVDDGSTDGTAALVSEFAGDPRVRYAKQSNQGPSAARNRGIAAAKGQWIAFLDSDDRWTSEKLGRQLRVALQHPEARLIYSAAIQQAEDGKHFGTMVPLLSGDCLSQLLLGNKITGSASSAMVRRDALDGKWLFDPELLYAEDWDVWLRVAAAHPVAFDAEPTVILTRREESHGSGAARVLTAQLRVLDRAFDTFAAHLRDIAPEARAEAYYMAALTHGGEGTLLEELRCLGAAVRLQPGSRRYRNRLIRCLVALPPRALRRAQ